MKEIWPTSFQIQGSFASPKSTRLSTLSSMWFYGTEMNEMNRKRRQGLQTLYGRICQNIEMLGEILYDERETFGNVLEGLQEAYQAAQMENAIGHLEDAYDALNDAVESIREVLNA